MNKKKIFKYLIQGGIYILTAALTALGAIACKAA